MVAFTYAFREIILPFTALITFNTTKSLWQIKNILLDLKAYVFSTDDSFHVLELRRVLLMKTKSLYFSYSCLLAVLNIIYNSA